MSDTTAMIDVTATMLPRTVMNDRSFADQIASNAIRADSQSLFIRLRGPRDRRLLLLGVDLHGVAVRHAADGVVRSGDHLIAGLQPGEHLEVALAGYAELNGDELGAVVAQDEHAFGFLPHLAGFQFLGRCDRFDGGAPALVDFR